MEYQKIMNLFDNTPNQPFTFGTKNWVEINDESRRKYDKGHQTRFESSMLRSSFCSYSDAYVLPKGTITVANTEAADAHANNTNKKVIFINCVPFTNYIRTMKNTHVDDTHDFDVLSPIYNLTEYSDNYSKTSGNLQR